MIPSDFRCTGAELTAYVAQESLRALRETSENLAENGPLVQACCWCLGEFGETLSNEADEVVSFLETILMAHRSSLVTKQYALLSVAKLHTRCPSQASVLS